jgi:hypothetical protein
VSESFTVDPLELRATARQAYALFVEFAQSPLPSDALDGIAGSSQVAQAYDAFLTHWSDGLQKAGQQLNELSERLASAADGYLGSEQKIERAASSRPAASAQPR